MENFDAVKGFGRTLLSTQGIETRQSVAAVQHNSNFIYHQALFIQICDLPTLATPFVQSHSQYTGFCHTSNISNQPQFGARTIRLSRIVFSIQAMYVDIIRNKTSDMKQALTLKNRDIWIW